MAARCARSKLRASACAAAVVVVLAASLPARAADFVSTIARVKPSIVAIGTFQRTRSPPFEFRGTGFAVGDGSLIVTNVHVLPPVLDPARAESIAIALPAPPKDGQPQVQIREAHQVAVDPTADLAMLKVNGTPLPALKLGRSETIREGQEVLFTGFPIGAVLGIYPATHRGMISSITPIAIPQARAAELDAATARRLASGAFPVFQLDATAYPGNSGSPLYDPLTGDVLGVINMVFVKGTKESALTQPSGITYAVPARYLHELLDKVR